MSSRRAGSVLLNHLRRRVCGSAAPSRPLPLPTLADGRHGGAPVPVWARPLSIAASESTADVAEVYAAKKDYASTAKVEVAIIAASEARADVAEVYASKEDYMSAATLMAETAFIAASEARADVAEVYASKKDYASTAKVEVAIIAASEARADVAEVYASKEE